VVTELWTDDPRLAALYDAECVGRRDHDFYVALAHAIGAGSVVDIGCGTGVLAVDLAGRGLRVVGVDPSATMLDVARRRPGGSCVEWIHGEAADAPNAEADLAVMTGHVAQYFVDDRDWADLLRHVRRVLVPGGRLAFETRNPAANWAQRWTRERTTTTFPHPDGGDFTAWVEMSEVTGSPDSYTTVHVGHTVLPDGTQVECSETLRFRSAGEILASLDSAGFAVEATWGDWNSSPFTSESDDLIVLARRETRLTRV
jgi:SAM-dependent methyltransferase